MTGKEFETYFRQLYMPLGMYALRMVNDADVAEDLVQDAFVKAWTYAGEGRRIDSFAPFMYRTVRNVCLTYLRDRRETVGEECIPEADDEAIDDLPAQCRRVFLLSKRDGLSNEEIAEELGISVKTVKNQMTKAFSRLREALSDGHRPFFLPFL